MILTQPSPTAADLHFTVAGIPVRVHPFFWVTGLLLSGSPEPASVAIWIGAVFLSILVHELGHAFLQRHYGGRPHIVLYGLGGLAVGEGVRSTPGRQILISLTGPLAGFLFAALLWGGLQVAGFAPQLRFPFVIFRPFSSAFANELLLDLFYINILWGLLNLLPIYPLDGGQVVRELFTLWMPPQRGIVASLWLSVVAAGGIAAYFAQSAGGGLGSWWPVLMFGLLAYSSFQTLQAYNGSRRRQY